MHHLHGKCAVGGVHAINSPLVVLFANGSAKTLALTVRLVCPEAIAPHNYMSWPQV